MTDHLALLEEMLDRKRRIYFASPEGSAISLHELNALDAAIALMRGQSWQSIETAPKDGTDFLAWGKNYGMRTSYYATWLNKLTMQHEQGVRGSFCLEDGKLATHWQPLPTPPKDTADEQ